VAAGVLIAVGGGGGGGGAAIGSGDGGTDVAGGGAGEVDATTGCRLASGCLESLDTISTAIARTASPTTAKEPNTTTTAVFSCHRARGRVSGGTHFVASKSAVASSNQAVE